MSLRGQGFQKESSASYNGAATKSEALSVTRKKHKQKSKQPPQPFAPRILDAFQRRLQLEEEIAERDNQGLPENPDLFRRSADAAVTFESLLADAHEQGVLKKTISSVHHLFQTPRYEAIWPKLIELNESMSTAYQNQYWNGQNADGTVVPVRAAVFGIPVSGSREAVAALVNSDFVKQVKKNGWMPKEASSVVCMGALSAIDALGLVQDPYRFWSVSHQVFLNQAGPGSFQIPVPGLFRSVEPSATQFHVGGYVLLMGVFGVCEDEEEETFVALDLSDNQEEMEEAWYESVQGFLKGKDLSVSWIGVPDSMEESAREAVALQLDLSVNLLRATEHVKDDAEWVESAFEVDPETRAMDLVALFSDGTHVRLPNALVGDLFLLSEDIANRLTIPAFFFMKGENPTWETPLIERAAGSLRLN